MIQTKFVLILGFASALLISALFLQWYVAGKIDGYEHMLSLNGLTEYDKGMLQGTLDWWIIQKSMLFDPVSYLLITVGIIANVIIISVKALSLRKQTPQYHEITQKPHNTTKSVKSQPLNKSKKIAELENKITKYQKQLLLSKHRINNLKENMDYLVKIINDIQDKSKPLLHKK
jgi:hypothetical protein